MRATAADEPPLDRSRDHLLEARALERAAALAADEATRARLAGLADQRAALMAAREAFNQEATARRHARGEIYSAARVAALNAMGPDAQELEQTARTLYGRHTRSGDVLKAHARVHFVNALMAARLNLAHMPADIAAAARAMQAAEEAFAKAWLAAIDVPAFTASLRADQRQALRSLRTATRPMYFATAPSAGGDDDVDAAVLGRAWAKLDDLAETLGVEPLSAFIALPDEGEAAGVPAARLAASIAALCEALGRPGEKFPAKKATLASLARIQAALAALAARQGRAWFEVDL